ncbi:MAG: hypothetical protein FWG07_03510 [Treponema sp.]|nr:hypothetical protein [Treponema sp.]
MRKPVIPRFLLLLFLYAAIFITLVYVQFNKKTSFTLREGDLVIQGSYVKNQKLMPNIYPIAGKASVFFGGMEFILADGLELSGFYGGPADIPAIPQVMTLTDNEVYFRLREGPDLVFTTQYSGGAIELRIRADFSIGTNLPVLNDISDTYATAVNSSIEEIDDNELTPNTENYKYHSLKIPFKALPTSIVQNDGQQLLVNANGNNYTFSRSGAGFAGSESGFILLEAQNPAISYRIVPDKETANPRDFIIPAALNSEEYETAVALWLDQAYMLWNRTVAAGGEVNGDLLNAYMSEALKRGTFRSAAAAVSSAWNPANVFYEASSYVGHLDTALRTLSATEREQSGRLARLFNEKSLDYLKEPDIIEFLAIRGYGNLIDDAAEILRTFDPAAMTVEQAAGILEGQFAWNRYRPGRYNPFERFVDQVLFVITGSLRKNQRDNNVLVFTKNGNSDEEADIELNLRLGKSLIQYEDETRNALGKTLILSVISLADRTGAVPRSVRGNFTGETERLDSQRVYRICFAGENYARAQIAGEGLWAWTASSSINGSSNAGRLEFNVGFPAGETHYLIIRGIKPFTTLQFNDITFNQNNQFERYDYSGWVYSASDQSLLVKIRHRLPTERIIIIF